MHSRISRFFIMAAVLVAFPVVAQAQTARLEGMALPGDYVKDYTAIYGWPSEIPTVGNLVYGELGNVLVNGNGNPISLDRSVGAVLGNLWDGRFGTWAIHLREQTPNLGQGDAFSTGNPGVGGGDPNTHTNESFDIMWGRKFGSTNFGLRVNRSFFKLKDEIPGLTTNLEFDAPSLGGGLPTNGDPNLTRNIFGISGGIGFEMNPQTSVEMALLYQSRNFESSQTPGTKYESDQPTTYQFSARAMWKWNANTMVVPVFKWYSYDLSTKTTSGATVTSFDNSLKGWQVGMASNWTLGTNDLFVLGATFAQNKVDQQNDLFNIVGTTLPGGAPTTPGAFSDSLEITESFAPQVFAALETHVNSWLTIRFGANKGAWHTYKVTDKTRTQTLTVNDSPFSMNIGAGVKLGGLQLDALLDNLFPHNPAAQFLGGSSSVTSNGTGVAFPKVTATYSF